ncbi:hypothetical protein JOE11_004190 [Robbsia andropogonis]
MSRALLDRAGQTSAQRHAMATQDGGVIGLLRDRGQVEFFHAL